MITHDLKIAFRNLLKYKTQSVVSVLGLAVGFVCFTLSTLWVNYEMTYDSFHPDAERIYLVSTDDEISAGKYNLYTPSALTGYLKERWEEVEQAVSFQNSPLYVVKNKKLEEIPTLEIDSAFMKMMNIQVLEGSYQFMQPQPQNNEVAITLKGAQNLFGTTDVIGKTLTDAQKRTEYRICAIVSDWGVHTLMPYQVLKAKNAGSNWESSSYKTLVKLTHGTDAKAWEEKMNRNFPKELVSNRFFPDTGLRRFLVTALTDIRHNKQLHTNAESTIVLRYIIYFAIIGLLIIVCAWVNHLTLFIDRCRIRQREIALRKVHGASNGSLLILLVSDFATTLFIAFFISIVFIELLMSLFCQYTGIATGEISIYKECVLFVIGVALVSLMVAIIIIAFFQRKSLQSMMHTQRSERIFRKINIVVQLSVSLAFILATVIMQKQIHHLRNNEVGFEYENRGAVSIWMGVDMNVWMEKIKALPMVTEVVEPKYWPLVGMPPSSSYSITSWDGLGKNLEQPLIIHSIDAGQDYFEFYGMQLLSGEWVNKSTPAWHINIIESTARKMGWTPEEALGKHLYHANQEVTPMTVIGVLKDCAFESPAADIPDVSFGNTEINSWMWGRSFVLFKYQPGTWNECRQMIENMQQDELPDKKLFLFSQEEEFNKYLVAEDTLSGLLNFASCVCLLIAIFGIYSLITLTCEQRRKEIAIRKVNGAKVKDILQMFLHEYLLLLTLATLVAFPLTYAIMKQWIETYNRQVEIGIWPFILVYALMALVMIASIGGRIWKAANENPAEVVKSE